jgi:hypothetical protein
LNALNDTIVWRSYGIRYFESQTATIWRDAAAVCGIRPA